MKRSIRPLCLLLVLLLFKWAPFSVDLPFRMEDIFYAVVKVALPVCILANVVLIIVQPDWDVPSNIKMGYLLAGTGIWPVILCVQNPNRRSRILRCTPPDQYSTSPPAPPGK